jgi:hypothetical protein
MADISPVVRRNAEWAQRFGGSSTNMAQRQRYANDQQQYADQVLEQQHQIQQDQLRTDKGARDLYFRQQNLERENARVRLDMRLKEEDQNFQRQLQPLKEEQALAAAQAARALELHRTNEELRQARTAARTLQDTEGFSQKVYDAMDKGVLPGSKEFADTVTRATLEHPFTPNTLRDDFFKQAKIQQTPDSILSDWQKQDPEIRKKLSNISAKVDANGNWTMGFTAPAEAKGDSLAKIAADTKAAATAYPDGVSPTITQSLEDRRHSIEFAAQPVVPAHAPVSSPVAGAAVGAIPVAGGMTVPTVAQPATAVSAPAITIPDAAVQRLKGNPALRGDFDAKFGEGSSAKYLGQ